MSDNLDDLVESIFAGLEDLDGKIVVMNSQAVSNSPRTNMAPSLLDRISATPEEAQTRQQLENTQLGNADTDDDEADDKIIEMWVDDIINRALE